MLLQVRRARKRAEGDVQLLSNRLQYLKVILPEMESRDMVMSQRVN